MHWKLVYLIQNPEKVYTGYVIDKRVSDALVLIPELDMQTTLKGMPSLFEKNNNISVCNANSAIDYSLDIVYTIKSVASYMPPQESGATWFRRGV